MRALLLSPALLFAAPASAATVAITSLPIGPLDPQGLVTAERTGRNRAHVTIMQTTGKVAHVALIAGGCANSSPADAILRVRVLSGRIVERTPRMPIGKMSWWTMTPGDRVCIPQARFHRRSAVKILDIGDTGEPGGLVAFGPVRGQYTMSGLFAGQAGAGGRFGPSTGTCAEGISFAWSVATFAPGNVVTFSGIPSARTDTWRSIGYVGRGADMCVKWEGPEFDA